MSRRGHWTPDELLEKSGLPIGELIHALLLLELDDRVRRRGCESLRPRRLQRCVPAAKRSVFFDTDGDDVSDDPLSLEANGLGELRTGDYDCSCTPSFQPKPA
jgi:DprA winged helix domain